MKTRLQILWLLILWLYFLWDCFMWCEYNVSVYIQTEEKSLKIIPLDFLPPKFWSSVRMRLFSFWLVFQGVIVWTSFPRERWTVVAWEVWILPRFKIPSFMYVLAQLNVNLSGIFFLFNSKCKQMNWSKFCTVIFFSSSNIKHNDLLGCAEFCPGFARRKRRGEEETGGSDSQSCTAGARSDWSNSEGPSKGNWAGQVNSPCRCCWFTQVLVLVEDL